MKVAIYGVSRSGKDHLIGELIKYRNGSIEREKTPLVHLPGSTTLNRIAEHRFGCSFRELSEERRCQVRVEFVSEVERLDREIGGCVVDGHYAFEEGDDFNIVMTAEDRACYDAFVYLDTPEQLIVERMRSSPGPKNNTSASLEKIRRWKMFELDGLRAECLALDKELFILDHDLADNLDFLDRLFDRALITDPERVASTIVSTLSPFIHDASSVILCDCDKTLSTVDMTGMICRDAGIDPAMLKEIFGGDRYSLYQFFRMAKRYGKVDPRIFSALCAQRAAETPIAEELVRGLKKAEGGIPIIGITSGIKAYWDAIRDSRGFPDIIIGGSNLQTDPFIISADIKRRICVKLKSLGKRTIAIGDSMNDLPMLYVADKGYLVAHEKLNASVAKAMEKDPRRLRQLPFSTHLYPSLPIEKEIQL